MRASSAASVSAFAAWGAAPPPLSPALREAASAASSSAARPSSAATPVPSSDGRTFDLRSRFGPRRVLSGAQEVFCIRGSTGFTIYYAAHCNL